ncbi:MAG: hypothetical protein M3014_12890 [Chloroflexota bacterium]|nr:hypothetical protein [Chloroflexota bacterium]
MSGLQTFSDWALSLLPRLFIFPGALLMAGALICSVALGGKLRGYGFRAWALVPAQANTLATATIWAALALLPFPGVAPLPLPADRLPLVALPLFSLLAEIISVRRLAVRRACAEGGLSLALLAPLANGHSLLFPASAGIALWVAIPAVAAGALVLPFYNSLPGAARMAAWFLLAALPLSGSVDPLVIAGGCLIFLFVLGLLSLYIAGSGFRWWAEFALGFLIFLSLLLSFLGI